MLVFRVIHHSFRVLAWCVPVVDMQYILLSFLSYNLEIHASSLKIDCVLLFIYLSILVLIFFYYFLFCFNVFWSFFSVLFLDILFHLIFFIQSDFYSFNCLFIVFYLFIDFFSISSLVILFHFLLNHKTTTRSLEDLSIVSPEP